MPVKLHVGNLDKEQAVDKEELKGLFEKYGRVSDIWVARQPPGFAFVTFEDERDAEDAVKGLNGEKFQGDNLRVQVSTNAKGKGDAGRRGGGRSRSRSRRRGRSYSSSRSPPPRRRRRDSSRSRSESRRRRR
eukprot:TRINITY_DN42382_c0_g1_i1.p1 TRINITY_DN42382_c0_g1~~TRINITY_DN42382_c0_g1_i1.p1  ORF type:complete len:143 (-),score=24.09 TRINITY_DN42382_c0_g1_i1:69-464(-)